MKDMKQTVRRDVLAAESVAAQAPRNGHDPKGEKAWVDPRIEYPCYKSLDEFIDLDRLRSLDGYIAERVRRHVAASQDIKLVPRCFKWVDGNPVCQQSSTPS